MSDVFHTSSLVHYIQYCGTYYTEPQPVNRSVSLGILYPFIYMTSNQKALGSLATTIYVLIFANCLKCTQDKFSQIFVSFRGSEGQICNFSI